MTNAECGQIIRNLGGAIEPECRVQLHAVGGTTGGGRGGHAHGDGPPPSSRAQAPNRAGHRGVSETPWMVSSKPRSLRATVVIWCRQVSAVAGASSARSCASDSSGANHAVLEE